jgi:asparagine synthase (glutamine-hydrolysing)
MRVLQNFDSNNVAITPNYNTHTLDKSMLLQFIDYGYLHGENSFFDNVNTKIVHPKFAAFSSLSTSNSYFNSSNSDKTFDYWYSVAEGIWDSVFDKLVNENPKNHLVPISGGLDSRAILGALLERLPSSQIKTFTFGTPKSLDYEIGNNIASSLKLKHKEYDLTKCSIIERLPLLLKHGNLGSDLFTSLPLDRILNDFDSKTNVWTGFMGDPSVGSHIPNEKLLKRYQSNYIKQKENYTHIPNFSNGMFGPDYDYSQPKLNTTLKYTPRELEFWDLNNRQARYVVSQVYYGPYNYVSPFIESQWLDFSFSLPNEMRLNQNFYLRFLLRKYPKLFSMPTKNNLGASLANSYSDKATLFKRKLFCKLSDNYRKKIIVNYVDYSSLLKRDPHLYNYCIENIHSLADNFDVDNNFLNQVVKMFEAGTVSSRAITILVSLNLLLSQN